MEEGRGKGYRFIDHTADIEFVARGATPEKMLSNALLAMFDAQADFTVLSRQGSKIRRFSIRAKGSDLEELLWMVLQDALSKADALSLFAYKVSKISFKATGNGVRASAVCLAREKSPEAGKFEVKGVSRFDLKVKTGKAIEATVVLDV